MRTVWSRHVDTRRWTLKWPQPCEIWTRFLVPVPRVWPCVRGWWFPLRPSNKHTDDDRCLTQTIRALWKEGRAFKALDFKKVTRKLDEDFICASLMRLVPTTHLCHGVWNRPGTHGGNYFSTPIPLILINKIESEIVVTLFFRNEGKQWMYILIH